MRTLLDLRTAQRSVARCDEFRETTRFAMTSTYFVEVGKVDVQYNRDYLYFGRADTFAQIGHTIWL